MIDRRTGTTEVVDDKTRDDIRGALLVDTIITQTIKMRDEIIFLNVDNRVTKQTYAHLIADNNQFDTV